MQLCFVISKQNCYTLGCESLLSRNRNINSLSSVRDKTCNRHTNIYEAIITSCRRGINSLLLVCNHKNTCPHVRYYSLWFLASAVYKILAFLLLCSSIRMSTTRWSHQTIPVLWIVARMSVFWICPKTSMIYSNTGNSSPPCLRHNSRTALAP